MTYTRDDLIALLQQAKSWIGGNSTVTGLKQGLKRIDRVIEILETESECLCLHCKKKWGCDFSLSAWAGKRRMRIAGTEVSFITITCQSFEEEKCPT